MAGAAAPSQAELACIAGQKWATEVARNTAGRVVLGGEMQRYSNVWQLQTGDSLGVKADPAEPGMLELTVLRRQVQPCVQP